MSEYIDREAFLKDAETRYCLPCKGAGKDYNGVRCRACWVDDMMGDVDDAPSADVAPVVRWVPVNEKLPKLETEVLIVCDSGGYKFVAPAIYEDGTMLRQNSCWNWYDIESYGLYDETTDDYFVPEGWWEDRRFCPDGVYNCPVDCAVTHWMPLPAPPKMEGGTNNADN